MGAGDLIGRDRQAELDGVLMGEGTAFPIEGWDLFALPDVATKDTERNDIGLMPGVDTYGGRLITIDLWLDSYPDMGQAIADRATIESAFAPSNETRLLFFRLEEERYCYKGRGRGVSTQLPTRDAWPVECRFLATDPRIYSGELHEEELDASTTLTNAGTRSTPWVWTVVGPCTGPRLRRLDDTASYTFDFPGLTLGAGQLLTVDASTGLAIRTSTSVIGEARDATGLRLPFPFLFPAGDVDWSFDADSGTPTSSLAWRDAWA